MHPDLIQLIFGTIVPGALAAAVLALLIARLSHPRPQGPFPHATTRPAPEDAPLARHFAAGLAANPGGNAVHLLTDPQAALAARLALIEAARDSVDLQYYIWQNDTSGAILMAALRVAAARGLRIRLLIDDNGTAGMDETLASLDALAGVEVRLFNPFPMRRARVLGYLSDFHRLNRGMQNKAMVADASVAVLGGRNIGDDYFDRLAPGGLYMDLDVAVAGPVVADVCTQFDLFWNSPAAVPARLILAPLPPGAAATLLAAEAARLTRRDAPDHAQALTEARQGTGLLGPRAQIVWAPAQLVCDPPDKVVGLLHRRKLLWHYLARALGQPRRELVLITPYLVPGRAGVRLLRRLTRAGVRVKVLTNSYAATDVPLVHSGYAHRRKPMLRAGVELYEYAPDAEARRAPELKPGAFLGSEIKGTSPFSRNKLHAKVFAVDRERVFIGSFNFDPRSLRLNTELGLVIAAPGIAAMMSDAFTDFVPQRAWKVRHGARGRLIWSRPGEPDRLREPGVPRSHRIVLWIAQRLPIEWML